MSDRAHGLVGAALLALAALGLVWLLQGCAHVPVLNLPDAGPLPYPDAGEAHPCRSPWGLRVEDRAKLCIFTVDGGPSQ